MPTSGLHNSIHSLIHETVQSETVQRFSAPATSAKASARRESSINHLMDLGIRTGHSSRAFLQTLPLSISI